MLLSLMPALLLLHTDKMLLLPPCREPCLMLPLIITCFRCRLILPADDTLLSRADAGDAADATPRQLLLFASACYLLCLLPYARYLLASAMPCCHAAAMISLIRAPPCCQRDAAVADTLLIMPADSALLYYLLRHAFMPCHTLMLLTLMPIFRRCYAPCC